MFDRTDPKNQTRAGRLAQLKRGPGVFTYTGGAIDKSCSPTVLMSGRAQAVFDAHGRPVIDRSGRQVFQQTGVPVTGPNGAPMLGGVPDIDEREIEVFELRGVSFEKGEPVMVNDPSLALKLRSMQCFKEIEADKVEIVEGEPEEAPGVPGEEAPKKRGRPKKIEE